MRNLVYLYTRVSTLDQVDGHSIEDQIARFMTTYKTVLSKEYDFGMVIKDEAISASKIALRKRRNGRKLQLTKHHVDGILKPGDVVYFDKLSRAFRSVKDWSTSLDYYNDNDIKMLFGDVPMADGSNPVSNLLLNVLAAVCQFESELRSQYAKERYAAALYHGAACSGGRAPLGYKKVTRKGDKKNKYLVPCYTTRRLMEQMIKWRDNEGLSFYQIQFRAECLWARLHGKDEPPAPHECSESAFYPWHFKNRKKVMVWIEAGRKLIEKGEMIAI